MTSSSDARRLTGAPDPITHVAVKAWRDRFLEMNRKLPEESAVALSYDRVTFAMMMASPQDLHDFAVGFSLSEGIIERPADILDFELAVLPLGLECRMELAPARREALEARRRRIAGPVGCGLCGMDSLVEALRPPKHVNVDMTVPAIKIAAAIRRLPELQLLNRETRAVHAAAFYTPNDDALLVREDEDLQNRRIIDKIVASAGLTIGASVVTNSFAGLCSHLVHGGWLGIVSHMFPILLGRPSDLVTIPLVEPLATQSIGLVISSRDPLSPIADALMATALKADFPYRDLLMTGAPDFWTGSPTNTAPEIREKESFDVRTTQCTRGQTL